MKKITLYFLMICILSFGVFADPVLDTISDKNVNEGELLSFDITCSAPDNGNTVFNKDGVGSLSGATDTQVIFSWTPGSDAAASSPYTVEITASDDNSTDTETFQITVNDVPQTGMSIEPSTINLGGDNQERAENTTSTFKIKNTGSSTITDISISSSASSDFKVVFKNVPSSISVGGEVSVTVQAFVPLDLDAVDSSGDELINDIGDLTVTGSSSGQDLSAQSSLKMQAENKLEISDLDIDYDDESENGVDDGDDIPDVSPGAEVTMSFEIENKFNDKGDCDEDGENCDIEDVEIILEMDDDEFGFDDKDLDIGDVKADDKETDEISFDVDEDADDDYDMTIELTGEDENGARHGQRWEITFEVEKPRDEIMIKDLSLTPSTLDCERDFNLGLTVENTGRDDQDEVVVNMESSQLDIEDSTGRFELEEGDDRTFTRYYRIPSDLSTGTYYITVESFYEGDESSDIETVSLIVRECSGEEEEEEDEDTEEEDTSTEVDYIEIPPSQEIIYGEPEDEGLIGSRLYLLILIVGIIVVLLLIILLIAVLVKK
jgi:hypothetical protein